MIHVMTFYILYLAMWRSVFYCWHWLWRLHCFHWVIKCTGYVNTILSNNVNKQMWLFNLTISVSFSFLFAKKVIWQNESDFWCMCVGCHVCLHWMWVSDVDVSVLALCSQYSLGHLQNWNFDSSHFLGSHASESQTEIMEVESVPTRGKYYRRMCSS